MKASPLSKERQPRLPTPSRVANCLNLFWEVSETPTCPPQCECAHAFVYISDGQWRADFTSGRQMQITITFQKTHWTTVENKSDSTFNIQFNSCPHTGLSAVKSQRFTSSTWGPPGQSWTLGTLTPHREETHEGLFQVPLIQGLELKPELLLASFPCTGGAGRQVPAPGSA